ncbi:hypothetical protein PG994_009560 [Apiospora phragmitis]|uniref:Uncharacterized protein n=1 Tax=Apiospora phragmitis TaxID=2905665 RepID=A0ABR1U6F9_9PEZI
MAKISPLAAKTLHNILASHANALEKKSPEANPTSVPLPKQTEDEVDELTFTYADFSKTENSWGSGSGSDSIPNSVLSTLRTSIEEETWGSDGSMSGANSDPPCWGESTNSSVPEQSVVDLWCGSDAAGHADTKWSGNTTDADRDGSAWGWEVPRGAKSEDGGVQEVSGAAVDT